MTTTTRQPLPRFDFSATEPVSFGRLVAVELRKTIDTRAGRWLLAAVLVLTAATILFVFALGADDQRTMPRLLALAAVPQGFLLPVLGILLVTSEWSQRTALVTFTLTASRSRVVGAKVASALLLASAAVVGAVVVAAVAAEAGGRPDRFADVTVTTFAVFAGIQLLNVLQGMAYGLILLNTPAAVIVFFLLPSVASLVFSTVPALKDLAPWLDLGTAQASFNSGDYSVSAEQLAQTGVTALIWVVLPFVAGWLRVMRAEVK
jgi:ABC-type transport system involved in multi-copper enzyme maturation permease subunit